MSDEKYCLTFVALGLLSIASPAFAQHADVLVQDVAGRVTSGAADFDNGQWTLGKRVFTQEFDSDYSVSDPGFNALAAGSPSMPAGAEALPASTPLGWDFLPMKIDGAASNLFYWNGVGGVQFGGLPGPDYELSLFGRVNAVAVEGSPELVPGDVINITSATGALHTHRFFFLDSGNNNATTTPADGIYLMSMRATMAGLDSSAPIYFLWGTPGSTLAALEAAETWATDRVDALAPDFDADFDGDLDVDGSDFLTWQRTLGMTSALQVHGDADRDRQIGAGDLGAWRDEFGLTLPTFPGAQTPVATPIPEPTAAALLLVGALAITAWRLIWAQSV